MNSVEQKINIELKDGFLKQEIRDEFLVTEERKKIWAVQMDLLNELLKVCKRHDIKVSVFAGSLLGVVRHQGFIPWDDDIDVCLTRENYEKLVAIAGKEFSGRYFFQTALSDRKYFIGYSRLRNSETTGILKWNNSKEYNNGIYIDIFPLDGYTDKEWKLKMQFILRAITKKFCSAYYADLSQEHGIRKFVSLILQNTLFKVVSYSFFVKQYDKVLQMNKKEKRVSLLTHSEQFVRKYWCQKTDLENLTEAKFEDITVPIPENFHDMLRHMYGDYMKFPPVEQRGVWHGDSLIIDPDISYLEYYDQHCTKKKD